VWCYHCHKPHHKNEPHRMRCQKWVLYSPPG
jgi:hypothetical protein